MLRDFFEDVCARLELTRTCRDGVELGLGQMVSARYHSAPSGSRPHEVAAFGSDPWLVRVSGACPPYLLQLHLDGESYAAGIAKIPQHCRVGRALRERAAQQQAAPGTVSLEAEIEELADVERLIYSMLP